MEFSEAHDIICNQIKRETLQHQPSVFLSHVILIHFPAYERVRWTGILTVQVIYHFYSAQWIFSKSQWDYKFSFNSASECSTYNHGHLLRGLQVGIFK